MASTDPGKNGCGHVCLYCGGHLSGLSDHGRLNHIEWCAIKVGVPDVKISTQISPGETSQKRGVAN